MTPTLAIERLSVDFDTGDATVAAVRDVSLSVQPAECVGIVGESGSGKTQLFMAVMGLLTGGGRAAGSAKFEGREMLGLAARDLNRIRGSKVTMVFQDPMTSLTPHLRIGVQLAETLVAHSGVSWRTAGDAALRMMERVRIPDAKRRLRQYPHELSGGMRQRVMIGMCLLLDPALLIADEPTTALDVTVQAQIIDILRDMRAQLRMAIVLVSHDFGVVAGLADRVIVMYAGRIVENAPIAQVLQGAEHPYTAELLKCVPNLSGPRLARLHTLEGVAPSPLHEARGCAFAPRCSRLRERCREERPQLRNAGRTAHSVACHYPLSS